MQILEKKTASNREKVSVINVRCLRMEVDRFSFILILHRVLITVRSAEQLCVIGKNEYQ